MVHRYSVEQVRAEIEKAWADSVYPGDTDIILGSCRCPECEEIEAKFVGKHWSQVRRDIDDLLDAGSTYYWSCICILSSAALHFYLPAFLIVSLDYAKANVVASSTLGSISNLAFRDPVDTEICRYTPRQRIAIGDFLRCLKERYPADAVADGFDEADIEFWTHGISEVGCND